MDRTVRQGYYEMLAEHVREVFPITRPTEPERDAKVKRAPKRQARHEESCNLSFAHVRFGS
jgi:hypothetical protein